MKVDAKTLKLLRDHGFKWYKDGCTDTVEPAYIEDVLPAANGFTVVYKGCVIELSTATVEKIEIPGNSFTTWIFVHWNNIEDQRK